MWHSARLAGILSRLPSAILPLAALALIALLTCGMLVAVLVSKMDDAAALEKARMVKGAITREATALVAETRDYGKWDDAVDHLYGDTDYEWAASNLGSSKPTYILDDRGATIFG